MPISSRNSCLRISPGCGLRSWGISCSCSVIVDDLDVFGFAFDPAEANSPLVVDPDAHLAGAAALQGFEPVARRIAQVIDRERRLHLAELAQRAILNLARKRAARLALRDALGLLALERAD